MSAIIYLSPKSPSAWMAMKWIFDFISIIDCRYVFMWKRHASKLFSYFRNTLTKACFNPIENGVSYWKWTIKPTIKDFCDFLNSMRERIGRLLKISFAPIVTDCVACNVGMVKLTINYDTFLNFLYLPNYLSGYQGPLTG